MGPSTGGEPCSFASLKKKKRMTPTLSVLNIFHPSTGGLGVVKISFTHPQGENLAHLPHKKKKQVNDTHTFCTKYLSPIHRGDLVLLNYLLPIHRGRTLLICLIKKKKG